MKKIIALLFAVLALFVILGIILSPNSGLILDEIRNNFRVSVSLPIKENNVRAVETEDYFNDKNVVFSNEHDINEFFYKLKSIKFWIGNKEELHSAESSGIIIIYGGSNPETWIVYGDIFIGKENSDVIYRIKGNRGIMEMLFE